MASDPAGTNAYMVLGVDATAGLDEIRKAYRRLALRVHPDHNPGDREAAARFHAVTQAYEALSDTDRRAALDRNLAEQPAGADADTELTVEPSAIKVLARPGRPTIRTVVVRTSGGSMRASRVRVEPACGPWWHVEERPDLSAELEGSAWTLTIAVPARHAGTLHETITFSVGGCTIEVPVDATVAATARGARRRLRRARS